MKEGSDFFPSGTISNLILRGGVSKLGVGHHAPSPDGSSSFCWYTRSTILDPQFSHMEKGSMLPSIHIHLNPNHPTTTYNFCTPVSLLEPHLNLEHLLYCDVFNHVIGWASVNWWAPFWRWVTVSLYEVGCQLTARLLVKRYNVYIDLLVISWYEIYWIDKDQ